MKTEKEPTVISNTILVNVIDWKPMNEKLTTHVHERFPENKDKEYEIDTRYSGVIDQNGKYLVLTDESVAKELCVLDAKENIIGINIGLYEKPKDNMICVLPAFEVRITVNDIESCKTGETKTLRNFMGERYRYNYRIISNEKGIIKFMENENI
jgi:hypothetical protein